MSTINAKIIDSVIRADPAGLTIKSFQYYLDPLTVNSTEKSMHSFCKQVHGHVKYRSLVVLLLDSRL